MLNPSLPPIHGWSLCEAAAVLFPAVWAAATLPDDDAGARSHPGIVPPDNPLAAFMRGGAGEIPGGDLGGLMKASRTNEAMIEATIAAARKAADAARDRLPRLFAERMQKGDLLAYAVNMAAGVHAPPTLIQPHLWGVAKPHFGFDKPTYGLGRRSYTMPPPEAGSVSGLPGGARLYAVRITHAPPAGPSAPVEPAPAAGTALADPKLVCSLAALRYWYASRRSSWPPAYPAPGEAADIAAASQHFGVKVSRDTIRAIRRELAPPHWKKSGPRKPSK